MFVRFVCPDPVVGMAARSGFFCAAYELNEAQTLDPYSQARLEHLLQWFREHLAVPTRFNSSKSKGAFHRDTRGLSWFKPNASEALSKSYELIALLAENGYVIETLRSDRVGYVVYEDDHQIVAEPFADTPS
ncbi:hypothetical protein RA28_04745 [Ruegeria sp. ANG-S4]|nr:hypothetical protein RA28_04745 [Ruegeria sp. ANG-S4]